MIREIRTGNDVSIISGEFTAGLGRLIFHHPIGTFSLTPASNILIETIIKHKDILSGIGIDWGSGVGCLAILAAKIRSVDKVYGLEISPPNIEAARKNAQENGVADKSRFILADSYSPYDPKEKHEFNRLRGRVNFIVANPPSSDWDDGFGYRRIVMKGAKDYLIKDGIVLLNISFQYGIKRMESLYKDGDYSYMGIGASTDWVQFDMNRTDLLDCLKVYVQEEQKGGLEYIFKGSESDQTLINATAALDDYYKNGTSPLTKWQTHIFKYSGK